jgi:mRNA-degrading endonuclease YafQ of YafQ-DinJ toxin-antitoxin module
MIGFIDAFTVSLILNQLTTAHSQQLPKTHSLHSSWTTTVFSSTVTDLILIYESLTSASRMNSE